MSQVASLAAGFISVCIGDSGGGISFILLCMIKLSIKKPEFSLSLHLFQAVNTFIFNPYICSRRHFDFLFFFRENKA